MNYCKRQITDSNARILEIGPLCWPNVSKKQYPNVYYADIRSTEDVKAFYRSHQNVDHDHIVAIDYVISGAGYEDTFRNLEKFDYVVASHVIEHVEDILFFFNDVSKILKENGKVIAIYPDKKYCFDHFRASASFRDAIDVYWRGKQENARMVLDSLLSSTVNDPFTFWGGKDKVEYLHRYQDLESVRNAYNTCLNGSLVDVHFWPFTDESFLLFLYHSVLFGLMPFTLSNFMPTGVNTLEFNFELTLSPDTALQPDAEITNIKRIMQESFTGMTYEYFSSESKDDFWETNSLKEQIGLMEGSLNGMLQLGEENHSERDRLMQETCEQLRLMKESYGRIRSMEESYKESLLFITDSQARYRLQDEGYFEEVLRLEGSYKEHIRLLEKEYRELTRLMAEKYEKELGLMAEKYDEQLRSTAKQYHEQVRLIAEKSKEQVRLMAERYQNQL